MHMRIRRILGAATAAALAAALVACGTDSDNGGDGSNAGEADSLVIYSGRSEDLVGGLLDDLEAAVGVPVEVRYADSAELAAQLAEEGDRSPADLFFSQDAGALGALVKMGQLAELPGEVLGLVDEQYRDAGGHWVATSGRARVIAYNSDSEEVADFDSIDDLLDEQYRGRIGFAPTNASWMSFVTALRVMRGEEGAEQWLAAFAELEPVDYEKNGAVLEAVNSGEVDLGLINHYYWHNLANELGDDINAQVHFLDSDDPGALINIAGAGILASSDNVEAAEKAVAFLLSEQAQQYFADVTAEFPVVAEVSSSEYDLGSLADLDGARLDLNDLDTLEETQVLLEKVGLL
jgi:iron(III) transport system substrate-binding protein